MKLKQVIKRIEGFAPPELALFDYVGLLQGDLEADISKVGLTLDYSLQAIEQAIDDGCELLITHHGPIDYRFPIQGNALEKIRVAADANLAVYRCHSSLDFCKQGIIEQLCSLLEIPAKPVELTYRNQIIKGGVRLAQSYPLSLDEIMRRAKSLGIQHVRIAGSHKKLFSRIAVTSGKGFISDFFDQLKPDVYIAGEFEQEAVKYAEDLGIMLIELSHHASESRPLEKIAPILATRLALPVQFIEIPDTITCVDG